jgi:hypothetical protein
MELVWKVAPMCSVGDCVAVALTADGNVSVADTKNPEREPHTFTSTEWDTFLAGVRAGAFDRSALSLPGQGQ